MPLQLPGESKELSSCPQKLFKPLSVEAKAALTALLLEEDNDPRLQNNVLIKTKR